VTEPLQELAERLCQSFCGWKLQHDRRTLSKLGSGRLEVDLVKKTCRFGHNYIPRLIMVDELIRQLRAHLQDDGAAPEELRSAALEIRLTIEEREDQKDKSVVWFGDYDGFVGCEMEIRCTLSTDDESCKAEHRGYVEWPKRVT
jgi:hypothetical protein